jgi:competence protein ComEC
MNSARELPFVKLLTPFIIGTSLVIAFPSIGKYTGASCILLGLLCILLYFLRTNWHANFFNSLSILGFFLCFGGYLTNLKADKIANGNILTNNKNAVYLIKLEETPQEKAKTFRTEALVIGMLFKNGKFTRVDEKTIIYFLKPAKLPQSGSFILINCQFKSIPEPENQFQFNYKKYIAQQGIHCTAFISSEKQYYVTRFQEIGLIKRFTEKSSSYLKALIHSNMKHEQSIAVTESLLFGYKSDISKDLVNAYSRTGTLHVLAVSGMHVAIVFLLFAKSLWFMERFRYGSFLRFFLILIGIWGYCLLTGMAPSIIRAGLMISLIMFGKLLKRYSNVYNLIAFSALIILLINPLWILNIGFQLSYMAVLGIVYFQPKIQRFWYPSNLIFKEIWSILNISICAQIATFPLSLYYFHQFPNYFLFTNLIIIPLTTLVIYSGICMVIFSKCAPLLLGFAWITEKMVEITNYLVMWFEDLPYSFTDGVKINNIQLSLLYILVFCIALGFLKKSMLILWTALTSVMLIVLLNSLDKLKLQKQNQVVIFNIPNYNAILIADSKNSVLISDEIPEDKKMYYIRGWLIENRQWPITQTILIKDVINQKQFFNKNMGLCIEKGLVFFKSFQMSLSEKINIEKKIECIYVLPDFFDQKLKKSDYMSEFIVIGHGKSKRLHKKIKNILPKSHNNVNKIYPKKDHIRLIINL